MNTQEQKIAIAEKIEEYIFEHGDTQSREAYGKDSIEIKLEGIDYCVAEFDYGGYMKEERPLELPPYLVADVNYEGTAYLYDESGELAYELPINGRMLLN